MLLLRIEVAMLLRRSIRAHCAGICSSILDARTYARKPYHGVEPIHEARAM